MRLIILILGILCIPSISYSQSDMDKFCKENPYHWKCNPLPVKLEYFTGYQENQNTILSWIVAQEVNCDYYVMQGSNDIINWNNLEVAYSTFKTINQQVFYKYRAQQYKYYKLIQVDVDRTIHELQIINVNYKPILVDSLKNYNVIGQQIK